MMGAAEITCEKPGTLQKVFFIIPDVEKRGGCNSKVGEFEKCAADGDRAEL